MSEPIDPNRNWPHDFIGEYNSQSAPDFRVPDDELPWSTWPWNRCRAYRPKQDNDWVYFGRCDLKKKHEGDHALDRGLIVLRWSTNYTAW